MDSTGLKAVAFDMDGTLFNSFSVSYDAIREGFESFWAELGEEGPIPAWDKVKRLIGLPSYEFYPAALPESHREHWRLLHRLVGDAERRRLADGKGRCFDGVHETLDALGERGYVLCCLTNASRRYLDAVLDGCDLRKHFRELCHLGEDPSRDKVDVLREWAAGFGGRDRIVYVGDRKADIEAAHAAGIRAVGVTWGYGSPGELAEAEAVIDRMPDLLRVLGL